MAVAVAVVIFLSSGVPIVRHHAPMLALNPMWNRFQYVSVFNLISLLNLVYLNVNCHWLVIASYSSWSRPCCVVPLCSD